MRALAVLAVIGFHAFPGAVPGGFIGVDVFFVISGYLITTIITRALADHTFTFRGFYARRIRRIFPALIVVLAASLVIGWFLLLPVRYANLGTHVVGAGGFVANFVVWSEVDYFDVQSIEKPLLHLWSLGVEEQFYLVWPLLLAVLARFRARIAIVLLMLAIGSFSASVALVRMEPAAGFYLPVSRMWELALGGILVFLPDRERRSPMLATAGLAAIAAGIALVDGAAPYPGWLALLPTVGTALVIVAGPQSPVNRVLGARPLVAIGLVSYPLYLWHWTLLSFGFLAQRAEPSFAAVLALLAVSGVLATLTYLVIERPLRRRPVSLRQALSLGLALVVVAWAGTLVARDGVTRRFPDVATKLLAYRYDYRADAHAGTCWLNTAKSADGFAPSCMPAKTQDVFVWGDSHGGRLRPGLERVYDTFEIGSATRDMCPPTLSTDVYAGCLDSNRRVLARLEAAPPKLVLLVSAWRRTADITEIAERLARTGSRVIVLGPVPHWVASLPAVLYDAWNARSLATAVPRRLSTHLDVAAFARDRTMKALPWPSGVTYVSVIEILCDSDGCATYVPGSDTELTAYDECHLTTAGASVIARALKLRDPR
jgi:peptidoglycan/LPS O-acetylase OafA/YrhL